MSFLTKNFSPIGSSARRGVSPAQWSYQSSTDNKAAVLTLDYFSEIAADLNVGDFINLSISDGNFIATVKTVSLSPTGNSVALNAEVILPGDAGGWNLFAAEEITESTANFTVLNLTKNHYRIKLFGVIPVTDDQALYLRVSNDNGSLFNATNYQFKVFGSGMAGTTNSENAGVANEIRMIGDDNDEGVGNGGTAAFEYGATGYIDIRDCANADFPASVSGVLNYMANTREGFGADFWGISASTANAVGVLGIDAVRIFFASGNIAVGRFEVWETTS